MERLKNLAFILGSIVSPFGATVVKPWPGTKACFKDTSEGPPSTRVRAGDTGEIIIPTGSSAEVSFERNGQSFDLTVNDYRKRPGHTPGAKISGEYMKFELDPKNKQVSIPGVAKIVYKKK